MLRENSRKSQKKEVSSRQSYKYGSASDIRRALKSHDETSLLEGVFAHLHIPDPLIHRPGYGL